MYMDGFHSSALDGSGVECINLLFVSWTLDTEWKFVFACVGVFSIAFFLQYLTKLRSAFSIEKASYRRSFCLIASFSVQILLSYFLMLVAMTYNVELFCMVCSGIIVGYSFFLIDPHANAVVDHCCPGDIDHSTTGEEPGISKSLL